MTLIFFLLSLGLNPGDAGLSDTSLKKLQFPNLEVTDQNGKAVHFYDDLIKDKLVAINFIFTTCPTVCPPMGANFAALQKELAKSNQEVSLISVSINPGTDTPARLKAWREKFGGGPGWNLVTGDKANVDKLLKMLKVFSADINLHAPFVVIGNARSDEWRYLNGLTEPQKLLGHLTAINHPREQSGDQAESPAARYFTDVALVDQFGHKQRLYHDLLKGKIVIMNSFFASCKGVCIKTMGGFGEIQDWLGDRLGKDVYMLSFSVDPLNDTPEKLAAYASDLEVKPGWLLLTGDKANMDKALTKMGHYVDARESHSNIFIIGNETTGLWKKAFGLAPTKDITDIVQSVIDDKGP